MKVDPMLLLHHAQFHGANRLADKNSRWYWIPSLLSLLAFAITLIVSTISRYEDNPTFIVQMERTYPVKAFPSVILCPEIRFVEDKIDQFLSELKYPPGMTAAGIRNILPQLAAFYSPDVLYKLMDLVTIEKLLDYNGIDVETVGRRLTTSCEETFLKCRWRGVLWKCTDLFKMELTGDGFCCVFNGRSLRREMEVRGIDTNYNERTAHWYTQRFGHASGLVIAVNQSQQPLNIDLSYKWIALQTSQHFADTTNNGTALNPGSEHWIAYFYKRFTIGSEAKELSTYLRRCKMAEEKLKYFPIYNRKYCYLEHEIANTLAKCKCVRTVHPRPPGTSRCRALMLPCANHAMVAYDNNNVCLPTCDVEKDYIEASSFELNEEVTPLDSFYNGLDYDKVTVVRIFIQYRKQYTKQRWSYYSYLDLFAQLGGMFNVFFGCSVLTLLGLLQLGWNVFMIQWQRLKLKFSIST